MDSLGVDPVKLLRSRLARHPGKRVEYPRCSRDDDRVYRGRSRGYLFSLPGQRRIQAGIQPDSKGVAAVLAGGGKQDTSSFGPGRYDTAWFGRIGLYVSSPGFD